MPEVLVVGAGPAGLTLASQLAGVGEVVVDHQLPALVIALDAKPQPRAPETIHRLRRAIAGIHPRPFVLEIGGRHDLRRRGTGKRGPRGGGNQDDARG